MILRVRTPFCLLASLAIVAACSSTSDPPASGPAGPGGSAGSGGSGGAGVAGGGAAGSGARPEAGPDSPEGSTGSDASSDNTDAPITDAADDSSAPAPPPTLAATGFFKSIAADGGIVLGDGVRLYEPRYKLWSDGADKVRWVYLPPNSKIDNTDQDHWSFPVGSKFWKEFSINGKRIETRLVYRYGPGTDDYIYATYWWKPSEGGPAPTDAELVPLDSTIQNANGTDHDVPFGEHCHRCHDPLKDHVLGFSAFQLSPPAAPAPALAGVTLKTLNDEGRLTVPTPNGYEIPGTTAVIKNALGYLHANCGNCHNDTPGVRMPEPRLILRVLVGQRTGQETGAYTTALNIGVTKPDHMDTPLDFRIVGGNIQASAVSYRMALRGMSDGVPAQDQMPPVATEHPDTTGIAAVNAWISTLPAPRDQ